MKTRIASTTLALTALVSAQGASAQEACVSADDLADTVTYAMPMLYNSVQGPCSQVFSKSPFMTNEADAFIDRFRDKKEESWPGTLRLLKVFMAAESGEDNSMGEALAQMPDEALRPLVDVIIGQMLNERIAQEIKMSTCSDVAEAMELIAPLPPENISALVSFIARQTDLKNPSICGAKKAATK